MHDGIIQRGRNDEETQFDNLLFKITEPKEVKFFVNNLNKINNIMKKVSIDTDEFSFDSGKNEVKGISYNDFESNFLIKDFSFASYLLKTETTPRTIEVSDIVYNKVETTLVENLNEKLGENLNLFVDDCLLLYKYIKDYKSLIYEIAVCEDYVYLVSKANMKKLVRLWDDFYVDEKVTVTDDIDISITVDENNQPEVFEYILNKKGTYEIYFNTSEDKIYTEVDDINKKEELINNESVCRLTISSKYFTGNSGMRKDKSSIEFKINSIEQSEDILLYTIIFNVNGKMKVANTYLAILL